MSNIWWCNQTDCWDAERQARVVCCAATERGQDETFRARTVSQIRRGDIIVHYISARLQSVRALSLATSDAEQRLIALQDFGVQDPCCQYGTEPGWLVEVGYFDLRQFVPRDAVWAGLVAPGCEAGAFNREGKVKQGYLLPFNWQGLKALYAASHEEWPSWALRALR